MLSLRNYQHDLIAHSHDHPQLVFGLSGQLEFEIAGRGSRIGERGLAIVPGAVHHACASVTGSHCLVLDVPSEGWLRQRLGHHCESSLRLLDRPDTLRLGPTQQSLVSWLASSPINDSVIAEQGAVLLLASLNGVHGAASDSTALPLAAIDSFIDQHLAHPLQVADLAPSPVCRWHGCTRAFKARPAARPWSTFAGAACNRARRCCTTPACRLARSPRASVMARKAPSPSPWCAPEAARRARCGESCATKSMIDATDTRSPAA